jgi:hypothetical protein
VLIQVIPSIKDLRASVMMAFVCAWGNMLGFDMAFEASAV